MPSINVVVDLSHHNGNVDLKKAAQSGLIGVIHKATQSTGYSDPTYAGNLRKAQDAGLLWGAYHFGAGGDGVAQADSFLNFVKPGKGTLLVLDFEHNSTGQSMSLEEARAFVSHVQAVTGNWPGLYAGHYLKEQLGTHTDPILANCWFWLSQYGPRPVVPVNWKTWTMWQYTDGAMGPEPHEVPGIGRCDRDQFNGTEAALRAMWAGTAAAKVKAQKV